MDIFTDLHWSDLDKLEEKCPGIKLAFAKLKQRKRLSSSDIDPLLKFLKVCISCSTNFEKILEFGLDEHDAKKVSASVSEVNCHHHTKTCRKYSTDCRFNFPKFPSKFNIIAQEMEEQPEDEEARLKHNTKKNNINCLLKRIKSLLTGDGETEKDIQLNELLKEAIPKVYSIEKDGESSIVAKFEDVEISFNQSEVYKKYSTISNGYEESFDEDQMRNALYHYALSFCDYGTNVILERDVKDVYINNYNPFWMLAWDGNMDIQLCLDYNSVITYGGK